MIFWVTTAIIGLISAIIWKSSEKYTRVANAVGFAATSFIISIFIIGVAFGSSMVHYDTVWSRPLQKNDNAWVKVIPQNGLGTIMYRSNNQTYFASNEDDDLQFYRTNGTPRVERRCSSTDGYVLPFGWDFGSMNPCDVNVYIPVEIK